VFLCFFGFCLRINDGFLFCAGITMLAFCVERSLGTLLLFFALQHKILLMHEHFVLFSDAKAVLSASASRSRRASDCAIAFSLHFLLYRNGICSDVLTRVSLCASRFTNTFIPSGSNRYFFYLY
jgi:hypothetical protein